MTPITRQEMFLNAAAGNEQALPEPITREEMFLKAIADNAGSGGGGLPSVSDVDDDKVLTVVDGAWAPAAASGGGGGVLVVHDVDGTLDKTWQEIVDADLAVVKADGETIGTASIVVMWEVDSGYYNLSADGDSYTADSASGYPVKNSGGGMEQRIGGRYDRAGKF